MKIALIQQHATASREENLERGLEAARQAAENGARMICFAELAFDRFYPQEPASGNNLELSEPIPGPTTEAFSQLAREFSAVIVLNLYEKDGSRTFDSSPVIDTDGRILGTTRMVHITDYEYFH